MKAKQWGASFGAFTGGTGPWAHLLITGDHETRERGDRAASPDAAAQAGSVAGGGRRDRVAVGDKLDGFGVGWAQALVQNAVLVAAE